MEILDISRTLKSAVTLLFFFPAPVKESSTIYDAFLEKEKARAMNAVPKGDKSNTKDITGRNGIAVKKSATNKKKQKSEQDKKKTASLDEAISQVIIFSRLAEEVY